MLLEGEEPKERGDRLSKNHMTYEKGFTLEEIREQVEDMAKTEEGRAILKDLSEGYEEWYNNFSEENV